jgi:hypothetical protein
MTLQELQNEFPEIYGGCGVCAVLFDGLQKTISVLGFPPD